MYVFSRENKFLRTKGGLWYSFPALQEADSLLGIQTCESCEETSSLFFFFLNLSFANLRNRKAELELQTLKCMKSNFKISASGILSWFPENLVFFPSVFLKHFVLQFSSVQFSRSVVSNSLRPHESQHARPPCPSPSPGVHSNSRPSSR